jgi:hypothetical protein
MRTPVASVVVFCVLVLGVGPAAAQEVCEGIAGIECEDPGQFCRLDDGECCCDFEGVCTDIPDACPAVVEPVCGCDGVTYSNRCEAERASVSVAHACACEGDPVETVVLTGFSDDPLSRLFWEPLSSAFAYNVYMDGDPTPAVAGICLYAAVPENSVLLQGDPPPGELWSFLVSALTPTGEGPLGFSSRCQPRPITTPCICTLPADIGPCDGTCPRWYHNAATGQCEEFVWGCCGGNANRFGTLAECEAACLDPCDMPAVHGPCDGVFTRWYHNVLTGACDTFIWGGCDGNANNFQTELACRAACMSPRP